MTLILTKHARHSRQIPLYNSIFSGSDQEEVFPITLRPGRMHARAALAFCESHGNLKRHNRTFSTTPLILAIRIEFDILIRKFLS